MNWYLFSGYAIFWALVFIYIVYIHRKQLELKRDVESLVESLKD